MILTREFYERDTLTVAKSLLGKLLVHETCEGTTAGKIVETEAYLGPEDKASHAYGNLRTERTEVQFGAKGHAYVYQIYGMYFCLNVTSGRLRGKPEAILVRALEPMVGIEIMRKRRGATKESTVNLANGPGRLCMAMGISKKQNGADVCFSPLHVEAGAEVDEKDIAQTTRVNVDYADEWKDCPWRFFVSNSVFVSKRSGERRFSRESSK
jgi:DNA-3-methyladenine glycosylase